MSMGTCLASWAGADRQPGRDSTYIATSAPAARPDGFQQGAFVSTDDVADCHAAWLPAEAFRPLGSRRVLVHGEGARRDGAERGGASVRPLRREYGRAS